MERLTNEEVRVDESIDRYLGPRSVLECMKPKLLDLVLNGPVLNSVSKAALRQIIRQLYSALAAYEDTGLTPKEAKRMSNILMDVGIDYNCSWEYVKNWLLDNRLRELAEADKDGRVVVLPCKMGDTVYYIRREFDGTDVVGEAEFWWSDIPYIGKTIFITREEAEKALEAMK